MRSQLGGIRRKFMSNHLITTQLGHKRNFDSKREENIIEWLTLF